MQTLLFLVLLVCALGACEQCPADDFECVTREALLLKQEVRALEDHYEKLTDTDLEFYAAKHALFVAMRQVHLEQQRGEQCWTVLLRDVLETDQHLWMTHVLQPAFPDELGWVFMITSDCELRQYERMMHDEIDMHPCCDPDVAVDENGNKVGAYSMNYLVSWCNEE